MSKIFVTAKKWGFFAGDNPAIGVDLPEKTAVREKHVLLLEQIPQLLAALEEPARTMVLVGVLTGLRIGEILALRWRDVGFTSGEIRVEQACYRGLIGTPKTKSSPPYPSPAGTAENRIETPQRAICAAVGRGTRIPHPQWHSLQRHEPVAQAPQANRSQAGDALAQLAHFAPYSRHALAARGSHAQGGASAVMPRCPPPSKFTRSRFRKRSARQSKLWRDW